MSRTSSSGSDSVNLAQWYSNTGTVPEKCSGWLVLGMFADTTLALDPDTGTVHEVGDGDTQFAHKQIHRDVESLVYALTSFQRLLEELENNEGEDVETRADNLRAEITHFDPLPFESEDSQWSLALEEVIDGIW
jgi:hypothetical protein